MSQFRVAERVIVSLAEQFVVYNNKMNHNQGLYFKICIDAESYGYEKDGNTHHPEWAGRARQWIHILVVKPHDVYVAVLDENSIQDSPPLEKFENKSNHNSCWREAIKLCWYGFDLWDKAQKNVPKEHRPTTKDQDIYYEMDPIGSNIFKVVEVETERLDDGYHNKLTAIKNVPFELTLR